MRRTIPVSVAAPIACSLDRDAYNERIAEFAELFRVGLIGRERTSEGIRFRFTLSTEIETKIRDLARREHLCCSFFEFRISVHDHDIWWDATVADREARPMLDELLALPDRLTDFAT